jgi:hypothetical protein
MLNLHTGKFIFLLIIVANILHAQQTITLYPHYENINDTIQKYPEGTLFIFKKGTYRLINSAIYPKNNQMFVAEPEVFLKGSIELKEWRKIGNYWVHDLKIPIAKKYKGGFETECLFKYGGGCTIDSQKYQGAFYWQDLFANDTMLWKQTSLQDVDGEQDITGWCSLKREHIISDYFLDIDSSRIYTLLDPTNRTMEFTVVRNSAGGGIIAQDAKNIVVQGFTISQHADTWGGLVVTGNSGYSKVMNNIVESNHNGGIAGTAFVVRNNILQKNGRSGGGLATKSNTIATSTFSRFENNEINHNNLCAFLPGWDAGASKFIGNNRLLIKDNFVHNNYGAGLWTDHDNTNILFQGNTLINNTGANLFHEIGDTADIVCNTIDYSFVCPESPTIDFTQLIYISNSSNTSVHHNFIDLHGSGRPIVIGTSNRKDDDSKHCSDGNKIFKNVINCRKDPNTVLFGFDWYPNYYEHCHDIEIFVDSNTYIVPVNTKEKIRLNGFNKKQTPSNFYWKDVADSLGYELEGELISDQSKAHLPSYCDEIPKTMILQFVWDQNCKPLPEKLLMAYHHPFSQYTDHEISTVFDPESIQWVLITARDTNGKIIEQHTGHLTSRGDINNFFSSFRGVAHSNEFLKGVVFYNLIPNKLYSFELQLLNSKAITTNSLALQNNSIRFCDSQTNTSEFNTKTIITYPNPCNELLTISIADELFTKSLTHIATNDL